MNWFIDHIAHHMTYLTYQIMMKRISLLVVILFKIMHFLKSLRLLYIYISQISILVKVIV